MSLDSNTHVGIAGAGTMGAGIAQVFLGAGFPVTLHDTSPRQLERAVAGIRDGLAKWENRKQIESAAAVLARLTPAHDLMALQGCAWIVEAIPERRAVKQEFFVALGVLAAPETILASNTSSISITSLGAYSGRPERTVGMHFFNPPTVMRLVEVVAGLRTDPQVVEATKQLCERLGKVPIVAKDRPGFVSNRVLMPMINEAIWVLEEGVANAEDVDQVMKLGMNHPMGPLELADFIGLDVCLSILDVLHEETGDPKFRPCPLLKKHVEAGWLGRKTGRGFFKYEP